MATPPNTNPNGYINEFGKPIGSDIDKWFEYGVKTEQSEAKKGFCSTKQTLYVILFIVVFIILAIVIIVPIIIGTSNKTG